LLLDHLTLEDLPLPFQVRVATCITAFMFGNGVWEI
jgi:hypothetical protein